MKPYILTLLEMTEPISPRDMADHLDEDSRKTGIALAYLYRKFPEFIIKVRSRTTREADGTPVYISTTYVLNEAGREFFGEYQDVEHTYKDDLGATQPSRFD